jgi:hypothetical protein
VPISYLKVTDENFLWKLKLPQDRGMEGAEDSLVQIAEIIVPPKKYGRFIIQLTK